MITHEQLSRSRPSERDPQRVPGPQHVVLAAVGTAVSRQETLAGMLQACAAAMVDHMGAALVRVWTLDEREPVLVLRASAGLYTHLDGAHGRIPIGAMKIGRIASERSAHLTNQVVGDPQVPDQAWAQREGIVAFAGYPLLVEDRLVGVLALFARRALAPDVLETLAAVADIVATGVERKCTETTLRVQAETLATINRVSRSLSAELDLDVLLQTVTDAATTLAGAQFGAFFYNVSDDRGGHYTRYTISGVPREAFSRFPLPRNTAVFAPTFEGEGVVRVDDITEDARYGHNLPYRGMPAGHLPVVSYLAVPVVARSGEVLGGLFFGHERAGVFDERAEQIVTGLAAQAAVAVENARQYQQVQQAVRSRDEFLSAAAHDLRTPLGSIKGMAQLLDRRVRRLIGDRSESDPTAAQVLKGLGTIDASAMRMTALIDELLDVTRLQMGRGLDLERSPVDLAALARDAAAQLGPTTERHQLIVEVDPTAADAGTLVGNWDRSRLQRVLDNLLGNAMKYSPDGGPVTIILAREAAAPASGSYQTVGAWAVVAVRDVGIGIPAADLPWVFERFHRAGNTLGRIHGTGIGLTSVRFIVESHGGTVAVESQEGAGTTVTVRLPLQSAAADGVATTTPSLSAGTSTGATPSQREQT